MSAARPTIGAVTPTVAALPREVEAVGMFAGFAAPKHYSMPGPSPAAEFMLELSRDLDLQALRADGCVGASEVDLGHVVSDRSRR